MQAIGRWAAPEHVADHAADARVGAAERLDGRRMVVGLGLEGDRRARRERDDPGVADERRAHERRGDAVGGVAQLAEQVDARRPSVGDRGPERLVGAVLAPRLGERLQLDVGRVAAERREVVADRRPAPRGRGPATARRRGGRGRRRRGRAPGSTSTAGASSEPGWRSGVGRARRPVLDDRVGDDPSQEHVGVARRCRQDSIRRPVAAAVTGTPSWRAACTTASAAASVTPGWSVISTPPSGDVPRAGLQERVGEERAEPVAIVGRQVALDEHDVGDLDGAVERDPERRRRWRRWRPPGGRRRGIAR